MSFHEHLQKSIQAPPNVLHGLIAWVAFRLVEAEALLEDGIRLSLVARFDLEQHSGQPHPEVGVVPGDNGRRLPGPQERTGVDGRERTSLQKTARHLRLLASPSVESKAREASV